MERSEQSVKQAWEDSFSEQIALQAFNTAPVEAVIRTVAYHLRDRHPVDQRGHLHCLEMGCGAGPNLMWLARQGMTVSGVDISPTALGLTKEHFQRAGLAHHLRDLVESPVNRTPFQDQTFDGIVEACVFQHLSREERVQAFAEVRRLLKPGGFFVGYMLDAGHTVYQAKRQNEVKEDPGTLHLNDGTSKVYLTNLGVCHFFHKEEFSELLRGFSMVDPHLTTYYLPKTEATKRGYQEYLQSMWIVFAIK